MTIFGYARVSTDGQSLGAQLEALKAAGCEMVFRENVSGAHADRAQLTRLLTTIDRGDILIVSRLDRLARSTRDLLNIVGAVAERGASFRSLADSWADTTTPDDRLTTTPPGRLMLTVLGGLAEFQRDLIRSRTGEGRTRAKARGVHMGRPPKLTAHQRSEALQALASGTATQADLVRRFNVSQSTISRLADKAPSPVVPVKPLIDADTERAARVFMQHLEGKYLVIEALLFGSRARGTHTAESDADIAVVLEGTKGNRTAVSGDMAEIAFDVLMETGILVEALPLWADELKRPETFSNPALIRNIQRDGLRL
jgi:DNA invertase Pin-like site-specific DNA recombinase/predicted nucleotidyltransferase